MMQYADKEFAGTYFESRLHTDPWDNATPTEREKALTMATRSIDRLAFVGIKADSGQELEFPREGQDDVPNDIKIAACEIALALLDGVDPELELEASTMTSQRHQGVGATYDRDTIPQHILDGIASATAFGYLKPHLKEQGSIRISRVS